MGGKQDARPSAERPGALWRTAGEVALLIMNIAAGAAALYGALKGSGLV